MVHQIYRRLAAIAVTITVVLAMTAGFPAQIGIEEPIPVEPEPEVETFVTHVTAYSSSLDETDADPFVTASGKRVRAGIVACPRKYPFGTRFVIEGQTYVCLDRLSRRFDHRIDIWKPSKTEALEFGKRELIVEVLFEEPEEEFALLEWSAVAGNQDPALGPQPN